MKLYINILYLIILLAAFSCKGEEDVAEQLVLNETQKMIISRMPDKALIAHRGTCHWAPEHTEAAMRFARNAGATYLECDLQRTADGYIVLAHDLNIAYKSNINLYVDDKEPMIHKIKLEDLLKTDIGSWYNEAYPEKARKSFKGLDILTLEDLVMIAEGYRIKRDSIGKRIYNLENGRIVTQYEQDPADNGNRPGIYPEIKYPEQQPGIVQDIKEELERLGWYADNASDLKVVSTTDGCVSVGNTTERVVLQTFFEDALKELDKTFTRKIPFCLLIAASAKDNTDTQAYTKWIHKAMKNNATIIAPCIPEEGKPEGFCDLLLPWMHDLVKESGLLIHAYTFNSLDEIKQYEDLADGFICNKVESAVQYFDAGQKAASSYPTASDLLDSLGY